MASSGLSGTQPGEDQPTEQILDLVVDLLGALLRAPPDARDASIDMTLARLGRHCGVDRSYVFREVRGPDGGMIDNTHEWCAEGIAPSIHQSRNLPAAMFDPWRESLLSDQPVVIEDVDTLPDSAVEKAHLQLQGIRSLLVVPMHAAGSFVGFVGFDAVRTRRVFRRREILLLKSVADAIGAVLSWGDATSQVASAQTAMAEAHDQLKATLSALPELVLEVDAEGRYLEVHTADYGQMMIPRDQLIGRTHEEVMPPDIAALNRRAMAEVDAQGRSGPHAFWADTPRGQRRYSLTVSSRPSHRADHPPGYVFVSRDVTDEWRLTREAERLGLIAQRMSDLVMIIGLDDRIEWVNPAFEARTGWSLDEVRGRTPPEVLHAPGTDRDALARVDAAMAAGQAIRIELLNRTRDGTEFWTDADIQPLHDAEGRLTGFVSVETDITQRMEQGVALQRLAQEAIEARSRLEMAVEALPDGFAYYDAEDRLVLCNERYRSFYPFAGDLMRPGVRFEELVRAAVTSGDVPVPEHEIEAWVADRMLRHDRAGSTEERRMAGNRWLRVIETATPDGGRVGLRVDITASKEAEQRLADIIEGAEAGTWEWDLQTGETRINARWADMLGYRLEELVPLKTADLEPMIHPEDFPNLDTEIRKVLAGKADHFEAVMRTRHRDGHWIWVQSRGQVTRWSADGKAEVMAGIHLDITALKRTEERLEQIIDAAAAGTWELDTVTGRKRVNARWAEMLGYTHDELSDRPDMGFMDLVHPDDLAILLDQDRNLIARGTDRFATEIRMRHKSGHWVWILSHGRVIARDTYGRPLRLAGIHLDITERKRLEAQLTAERDYLSRLMDTSTSGITALDGNGRIIFANREAERILGLSAAALEEREFSAVSWAITALDGGPFPAEAMPFARVMAERRTLRDIRFAIGLPGGNRRMLSVNAAPVAAPGLAVRVVCVIVDITEQVAAEAELRSTAERAEAANRAKSQFLANMSHEIRTPLNGVLGMAQVLEAELSEPRHLDMLATIRSSGELLLGVINDILDMSKIEAGKLALEAEPFVPAELGARLEAMHGLQARSKGLTFTLEAGPGAQLPRLGDPGRLAQILHNLVGNAVKFTETGGVTLAMDTDAEGMLELVVQDSGIGMTEEQVSRIFDEFAQADGSVTRRFGGTGLGMAIVRRLVKLIGGTIDIDSRIGQGTTVRLRLPLPAAPHQPAAAAPVQERSLTGLRVLAADDNRTNRKVLGAMLAGLGLDVVMTEDGRAAVNAWSAGRFDLYLLDISMPELDGISALAQIRKLEAGAGAAHAPALAVTANALSHQVDEYLQAGFAGHVAKPFRLEALVAVIGAALDPAG